MNNPVCLIASYLVNAVWEVSLIGGAGWVVSRFVKRLGPRVEHVAWVVTLALAVLTPALPIWRWLVVALFSSAEENGHLSIVFVAVDGAKSAGRNVAFLPPAIILVLLVFYGVALLYFAGRLGTSLYLTAKMFREAYPLRIDPDKEMLWEDCRRALSVKDVLLLGSGQVAGPVTIVFRRSALLLPAGFSDSCSDHDFLTAVAHECAHVRRRDFQKNLLYEIVSLVIAFHPVTWMVKSKIAQTREIICDGIATENLIDTRTYTQSLLRLAVMVSAGSRQSASHAIGIFDANILEERIMSMQAKKQHLSPFVKYGLILPAVVLLFSMAAGAGAKAVAIAPQTPSQTYGQVYKVGKDVSAPKLISSVEPKYPESARKVKGKFDGSCLINLLVDSAGVPHDVHVVRSLGADFDASAVKAVEQYRFDPARQAGEPVAVMLTVEVHFQKF